jgi:ABC-2 type transport system permease protein
MIKVSAFAYKNWTMSRRNAFTLFEILFWPVVGFLSVGLLAEFAALDPAKRSFIIVGVVAMGAVQVCQLDVAYGLLYDVWSKAVKHGFAAPSGLIHMLAGSFLVGILRGAAVLLLLTAAGYFLFGFDFSAPGVLPVFLFSAGLFLCSATVGVFVCILVFVFGIRAEVAAWSLVSLMLLVCGIYYPISILPAWVALIAEAIPLTYFLEYIRGFFGFTPSLGRVLLKGYLLVGVYLAVEIFLVEQALKRARRTGMLLRLSE